MSPRAPVIVVHGGAGEVSLDRRVDHVEGCRRAAAAGLGLLLGGQSALDAAVEAVRVLEDDPLFNAGTGACLTQDETVELDAAVMEGTTLGGGAVCALPPYRNPILVAREVLSEGRHVLYCAHGADAFARRAGFEPAGAGALVTEAARERLRAKKLGRVGEGWAGGTVGAVAMDAAGHVAAATSTGGTVGKARGRVGDTPILGAGTYADDLGGACSATGIGERIMRACLARVAVGHMRAGLAAEEAGRAAMEELGRFGGGAGIILVDREGRAAALFDTQTMSHAIGRPGGVEAAC